MPKQKANRIEYRAFPLKEIRLQDREGGLPMIAGHAAVFNVLSEVIWGSFRERVLPGAFSKTIGEADVRALWNHDPNHIIGRNKAGTLRLAEDETGLAIEIDPPDTQTARDLTVSMKRGDVDQMSFGFDVVKDRWIETDSMPVRELVEVRLWDVSPVTFPAYPETDVAVRSILGEAGLDMGLLTRVLTRSRFSLAQAPEDRDQIGQMIAILSALRTEPAQERHSGDADNDTADMRIPLLRRRLQLVEAEL